MVGAVITTMCSKGIVGFSWHIRHQVSSIVLDAGGELLGFFVGASAEWTLLEVLRFWLEFLALSQKVLTLIARSFV